VTTAAARSKSGKRTAARTKVGKYELAQQLGKGGFGEVFVGVPKSGQRIALKLLDATLTRDDEALVRFKREGETARRLDHPNIVRVFEIGASRKRHFIAMELVHGGSLKTLMDRPVDPEQAQKLLGALADAARGLAYAHAQGVVHRDVKPSNILLTRSGRAKVADFGLARAIDQSSVTTDGKVLGTAAYMSPEQARGQRATEASDVYSLGIVLYEVATGATPFQSDGTLGYLYQHAEVDPQRPVMRAPYPAELGALALACLAKDGVDRPAMSEVAERLAAFAVVTPRRWWLVILVLVALAAMAIAAYVIVRSR
jgi:eukaryotic-like serine/threonine-protein kinase